jgi:hypothetical protein
MTSIVGNRIEVLGAHRFRLTDHTRLESAVMRAAIAKTAVGSRMNMDASES